MALVTFEGHQVVRWIRRELRAARKAGWTGRLVSGHRSCRKQREVGTAYAAALGMTVAQVYPHGLCASNHVGTSWPRGAVDVTDPRALRDALRRASGRDPDRRLVWALDVDHRDAAHFSSTGH